ncbi:MAG: hypothetical protein ABJZ55_22120 [Fuerstiella sp.]
MTFRSPKRRVLAVQSGAFVGLVGYLLLIWDRPVLAAILPSSSVIVLGNWLPLWACFFVGIYLATTGKVGCRQIALSVFAFCFSAFSVVSPMFGEAPECHATSESVAFQYQTSPYTCSAACAVTLLRLHGISATEQEMAELCLTRQGTHWMGVYRALKLKTAGTGWDVVVEQLGAKQKPTSASSPGLLALSFDLTAFPTGLDHGFSNATGHSVVSLGTAGPGYVDIFDPSPDFGFEKWGDGIWQATSNGVLLKLVSRDRKFEAVARVRARVRSARQLYHLALR